MEAENEVVKNEVLHPERKVYRLQNPPTINYNDSRSNLCPVGWRNLVVGYHALHSVSKSYVNVTNDILTFIEPTSPTNIITNYTILIQYSIKKRLKCFGKKIEAEVQKQLQQFHDCRFVDPNKPQNLSY